MSSNLIKAARQTIVVNSFMQVDIRNLQCPIIAVYIKPVDYPDKVIARIFNMDQPTNVILQRQTLEEVRADIMQAYPWMVRFDRAKNDVLSIAETWI